MTIRANKPDSREKPHGFRASPVTSQRVVARLREQSQGCHLRLQHPLLWWNCRRGDGTGAFEERAWRALVYRTFRAWACRGECAAKANHSPLWR
jgi:hypothetical protein